MQDSDYDVSIFLITNDGDVIFADDYDKSDNYELRFVMLTNDALNSEFGDYNNSICINHDWWYVTYDNFEYTKLAKMKRLDRISYEHFDDNEMPYLKDEFDEQDVYDNFDEFCKHYIEDTYQDGCWIYPNGQKKLHNKTYNTFIWQAEEKLIPNTYCTSTNGITDYNGYKNTMDILNNLQDLIQTYDNYNSTQYDVNSIEEYVPAVYAVYNERVDYKGKQYNGYLPSIGQLNLIACNIDAIHNILRKTGANDYSQWMVIDDFVDFMRIFSSTQYDGENVWCFVDGYRNNEWGIDFYTKDLSLDLTTHDNISDVAVFPLYYINF